MSQATKGQEHRCDITTCMKEESLPKHCPDTIDNLACLIANDLNLTPDTVKYNYLKMFKVVGFIVPIGNGKYDLASETRKQDGTNAEPESFIEYAKKHPHKNTCRNCDKPIIETLTFCSKECSEKYKERHNNES